MHWFRLVSSRGARRRITPAVGLSQEEIAMFRVSRILRIAIAYVVLAPAAGHANVG